ncbi:kinase-like domain-containing protein, partial [Entophlyctis helioformis]
MASVHRASLSDSQVGRPLADYAITSEELLAGTAYTPADFVLVKKIGKGAFAKVYLGQRVADGKVFAVKVLRKDKILKASQATPKSERQVMSMATTSPFVVRQLACFSDRVHIYFVQEYLPGGDLFGLIKARGYLDNASANFYAAEILLALSYLHHNSIIYRDLKPENILLDANGHIKLVDLGFAKSLADSKTMTTTTFCGTPSYIAPEMLLHKPYTYGVDWWAFGILVFEMCSGCSPFQEADINKTFHRILKVQIRWPSQVSRYFTDDAKDLVLRLLEFNQDKRLG